MNAGVGRCSVLVGAQFYWAMAVLKQHSAAYRAEIRPKEVQSCAPTKHWAFGSHVF